MIIILSWNSKRIWKTIYLRECTEKYITFLVTEKKLQHGKKATKNISHRLQIIDSTRFMASSLLNLVSKI